MTAVTVVVDYGLCNLDSIARAIQECGGRPLKTRDPAALGEAERVVLPGVGAFREAMRALVADGWPQALREHVVDSGKPFLGICLGMQLMAETGLEGGSTQGLGLIPGVVRRLTPQNGERIPHIGWNEVHTRVGDNPIFVGIEDRRDFYFVHSYVFDCSQADDIVARTPYGGGFTSAVNRGHVFGVQFHPEKSQRGGFQLLQNFLAFASPR